MLEASAVPHGTEIIFLSPHKGSSFLGDYFCFDFSGFFIVGLLTKSNSNFTSKKVYVGVSDKQREEKRSLLTLGLVLRPVVSVCPSIFEIMLPPRGRFEPFIL